MPRFIVPEYSPVESYDLYQWIARYVQAMLDCRIEADFFSLQHVLIWRGGHDGTIRQMPDAEAQSAALAMRALYIDVLRIASRPDKTA